MLLTANDLAKEWQMTPGGIRKMAAEGRLPGATKKGKLWRFDPNKISKWHERNEIKPQAASWSINGAKLTGLDFNGMARKSGDRLEQLLRPKQRNTKESLRGN